MEIHRLHALLQEVQDGSISVETALETLKEIPPF